MKIKVWETENLSMIKVLQEEEIMGTLKTAQKRANEIATQRGLVFRYGTNPKANRWVARLNEENNPYCWVRFYKNALIEIHL